MALLTRIKKGVKNIFETRKFLAETIYSIFVALLWHLIVFLFTKMISYTSFLPKKQNICVAQLRKKVRFYEKIFAIKSWKDKIPQYISKDGFSKKTFERIDMKYLEEFIAETLRAEWNHYLCCVCVPFIFFANEIKIAFWLTFLVVFGNLPCIMIQRYNRARLFILHSYTLRKKTTPEVI